MIDIHTHILPDIDDGPPDMETSIGMGRIASEDGITAIISTSHGEDLARLGRAGAQERLDEVREAWRAAGVDIRLELGVEIFLAPRTAGQLQAGRIWPLARSRYVLVELPYQPWPSFTEAALFDLQGAGYVPILAHPERYHAIQHNPNMMYSLAEKGILGQVTAMALLGQHGPGPKATAEALVKHRLVQFISSDSHGVIIRKRPPILSEAVSIAAEWTGADEARRMVFDNPQHILDDTVLVPQPERVPVRKPWVNRLFDNE